MLQAGVAYNSTSSSSLTALPELTVGLDRTLVDAARHLTDFKTDRTIIRDQAQRAVSLYSAIIDQNKDFDTLIKGWLRLRTLPAQDIPEAGRLRRVIAKIHRLAAQIIARATRIAETGPEKPPAILRDVPLSDIPVVIAALEFQITSTREDISVLKQAVTATLPLFTQEQLDMRHVEFREAVRFLHALTPQIAQWRGTKLTTAQRRQVATVAKQQRLLNTLLHNAATLTRTLAKKKGVRTQSGREILYAAKAAWRIHRGLDVPTPTP